MQTIDHLIAQLQCYLVQEYPPQSWLQVSRESYLYYRKFAMTLTPKETRRQGPEARIQKKETRNQESEVKNQKKETNQEPLLAKVAMPPPKQEKIEAALTEKPAVIEKQDFADLRKIMAERFPEQTILSQRPDDALAKTIKNAWQNKPQEQPEVFLVVAKQLPRHATLLSNICHAIKIEYGLTAKIVEKSVQEKGYVIDLADVDVYLQQPKLKAHLWKTISTQLFTTENTERTKLNAETQRRGDAKK